MSNIMSDHERVDKGQKNSNKAQSVADLSDLDRKFHYNRDWSDRWHF